MGCSNNLYRTAFCVILKNIEDIFLDIKGRREMLRKTRAECFGTGRFERPLSKVPELALVWISPETGRYPAKLLRTSSIFLQYLIARVTEQGLRAWLHSFHCPRPSPANSFAAMPFLEVRNTPEACLPSSPSLLTDMFDVSGFRTASRALAAASTRTSSVSDPDTAPKPSSSGKPSKQKYPLYPSVSQLLHEHNIPTSEAEKIPATGPKGRLLKGDVLAYLGSIKSSYSADQSARITKLGHLDLSNVKLAPPKQAASPRSSSSAVPPSPAIEPDTEIAVSISLKAVIEVQKRIQSTLGVSLPLSTFIARATEVANDDLPRSKSLKPSADELFDQVLGLDKLGTKTSRGSFTPQVTALPAVPMRMGPRPASKKPDIIDILTGAKPAPGLKNTPSVLVGASPGPLSSTNVFSVAVPKGEEKRARVFLERVKTILQVEPGSLVL